MQARPAWLRLFGALDAKWLEAHADPETLRLWIATARGEQRVYEVDTAADPVAARLVTSHGNESLSLDASALAEARSDMQAFHQRMLWVQQIVGGDSAPSSYKPSRDDLDLAQAFDLIRQLRSAEEYRAGSMPVIDVGEGDDALGIRLYLRLIGGAWDEVLAHADTDVANLPAWLAPVVYACSGDIDRLQECAASSPEGNASWGGLNAFCGLALKELRFTEAAFERLRLGLVYTKLSERAHYYVPMAELAHELNGSELAVRCLRWASAAQPNDDHLMIRVVRDLLRYGAFAEGAEILEKRAAKDPPHFEVLLTLAEIALWCGRTDDARGWIAKARELQPEAIGVLRAEGARCVLDGENEEALTIFKGIEALDDPETMAWMAELYMRKGDMETATHYLNYARARAQTPLHTLLTALVDRDIYPNVVAILRNEAEADGTTIANPGLAEVDAMLASLKGNRKEALTRIPAGKSDRPADLQMMLPAPQDADLVSRDLSAELLKTIRTQPIENVHAGFKALNEQFPESPHPWCYWGELRLWLGQFDEAEKCFFGNDKAKQARWGFVGRAAVHVHRGDFDAALDEFKRLAYVFEPVPGATTHVYLGELHRLRGEHEQSLREFEVALSAKPGRVAARMSAALCHIALGRRDDALLSYRSLVEKHPRLFWDISRALGHTWPSPEEEMSAVLEEGLRLMRGNRSSHTITYFDADDRFRIVEDVESWRRQAANRVPLVEREIVNRLTP